MGDGAETLATRPLVLKHKSLVLYIIFYLLYIYYYIYIILHVLYFIYFVLPHKQSIIVCSEQPSRKNRIIQEPDY